jgi:hypothetical protein
MTKKRRKLNVPVEIPLTLDVSDAFSIPNTSPYQLCGVILHFGTAMGGHYKAYTRAAGSSEDWLECDDASAEKLSAEAVKELFSTPVATSASEEATEKEENATVVMTRQQVLAENAYVLVYRKGGDSLPLPNQALPISEEVVQDNATFDQLLGLAQIRRKILQVTVRARHVAGGNAILATHDFVLSKQSSIQSSTDSIYNQFTGSGALNGGEFSRANSRLCKQLRGTGETFGDRQSLTLEQAGLNEDCVLYLDVKKDSDPAFSEFSPNDMKVFVKCWDSSREDGGFKAVPSQSEEESSKIQDGWVELIVPGQDKATVNALRQIVAEKTQFNTSDCNLISFHASSAVQILEEGNNNELKKVYNLHPGCHIVVAPRSSDAYNHLYNMKNRLKIFFNDPRRNTEESVQYDKEVDAAKENTLAQLRVSIATALGYDPADNQAFHLRQGEGLPQYKQLDKTLEVLGLSDRSIIHVQV